MNTLVHIIIFCARKNVAYAQKEHKVYPRINAKIDVYIIGF